MNWNNNDYRGGNGRKWDNRGGNERYHGTGGRDPGYHGRPNNKPTYVYELTDERFVNPYNFVSFPEKVKRGKYEEGSLTGYLELSLRTLTPLFIPNTSNDHYYNQDVRDHKSFDFYSYENLRNKVYNKGGNFAPIIPGSEIRGCIRAMHEIQNDSCLSLVDRERGFAQRASTSDKTKFEPYFLFYEDGHYSLYPAEKLREAVPNKDKDFSKNLHFLDGGRVIEQKEVTAREAYSKGYKYVRIGEYVYSKVHHTSVQTSGYYKLTSDVPERLKKEEEKKCIDLFRRTLEEYGDPKINKNMKGKPPHSGYEALRKAFESHKPIVVFAKHDRGWSLSPACIGKSMCPNDLGDFVDHLAPCSDLDDSCLTCQLFGFVDEDSQETHSGRLRFLDAKTSEDPNSCYWKWITLKELLGPHPSNPIFYGYNPSRKSTPADWKWDKEDGIEMRGRKIYLHSKVDEFSCVSKYPSNLNSTIHPVKSNLTFKSRIYFEGLTKAQLESLIKAINLYNASSSETKYAHKLGHAKPFGFGSVAMNVDGVILRKVSLMGGKVSYREERSDALRTDFSSDRASTDIELKNATSFSKFMHSTVCYPFAEGDIDEKEKGYTWFTNNKQAKNDPSKQQELPHLDKKDENQDPKKLELRSNKKVKKFNY